MVNIFLGKRYPNFVVVVQGVELACIASKPMVRSIGNPPRCYIREIAPNMMGKIYREGTS